MGVLRVLGILKVLVVFEGSNISGGSGDFRCLVNSKDYKGSGGGSKILKSLGNSGDGSVR